MEKALEFISFVPWTFIVMIANVYILYRLVRRFLFRPVTAMFEKRESELGALYAEANAARKDAESMKAQYDAQLRAAHVRAAEIVQSAAKSAEKSKDEILSQAGAKAEGMITRARAEAEQTAKKAIVQLREDISDMAVDIARQIILKEIDKADHERLINASIDCFMEDAV